MKGSAVVREKRINSLIFRDSAAAFYVKQPKPSFPCMWPNSAPLASLTLV